MEYEARSQTRTLSGITFILAAWLVISPHVLDYVSTAAIWTQTVFGIIIGGLALVRYLAPEMEWASWLNGLAALWLIIAPFILSYQPTIAYWNQVIVGIAIAILAFWNMGTYTGGYYHRPPMR